MVFCTGWGEASVLLWALVKGKWQRYRLPKASHAFDHAWQTEWMRIREVEIDDLWSWGKPQGWGGPWRKTNVKAGESSDPFRMTGFDKKVLHLVQKGASSSSFAMGVDFLGDGEWHPYETIDVPNGQYRYHVFPGGFSAHWLRITSGSACTAAAQLMYT